MYSKITKDKYINNFEYIVINMDRLLKLWYESTKEIEKYKYLIMLDLDSEELDKLGNKDNLVDTYRKKVVKLNEDLDFIAPFSAE